jgi:hypothetical protein
VFPSTPFKNAVKMRIKQFFKGKENKEEVKPTRSPQSTRVHSWIRRWVQDDQEDGDV